MNYDKDDDDISLMKTVGKEHTNQDISLIGVSKHHIKHANYKVPTLSEAGHKAVSRH